MRAYNQLGKVYPFGKVYLFFIGSDDVNRLGNRVIPARQWSECGRRRSKLGRKFKSMFTRGRGRMSVTGARGRQLELSGRECFRITGEKVGSVQGLQGV